MGRVYLSTTLFVLSEWMDYLNTFWGSKWCTTKYIMVSSTSCVFLAALFPLSMQGGWTAETNHSVTVSKVFCSLLASCTWNAWRSEVGNFNQEIPTSNADWNAAFILKVSEVRQYLKTVYKLHPWFLLANYNVILIIILTTRDRTQFRCHNVRAIMSFIPLSGCLPQLSFPADERAYYVVSDLCL